MKSKFTSAALFLLFATAAVPAAAQFEKVPGFVKQYELGYGFSFATADYIIKAKGVTPDGIRAIDTTITHHISAKQGFTGTTGTSLKLKRLGMKSTLALGLDLNYSGYLWDFRTPISGKLIDSGFRFYYDNTLPVFDGATVSAGLAITADFKFGTDAMMDKHYRWGWTIGIGAIPVMSATAATNVDAAFGFGVQPIVKGDIALRGPIVAKLRLQYSFGNITYLDFTEKSENKLISNAEPMQTQIIGKSNFTVSVLLLPLSFMYKKSTWYNSY